MTNIYDGTTRLSLFCQINSISVTELRDGCEHILAEHKDINKEDYIYDLIINEIGFDDGTLRYQALDVLQKYLPGGARQCFDNVFVGSAILPWYGAGNAYREGIRDADFRWANLGLQQDLWLDWHTWYGKHLPAYHFYINYEGVLDYMDEWSVKSGMEAYLIQSVKDAESIRKGSAILWSPAVWRNNRLTERELSSARDMFRNVKAHTGGKGVTWLHLQDMLGREWSGNDLWDVKTWYLQLKALNLFDDLAVNAELFTPGYMPLPLEQYEQRMNFYDRWKIPVRGSWEFRYWYREHKEL